MSKFNSKSTPEMTTTYEGGKLYKQSLENEWVNSLFSSFLEDGFYKSAEERIDNYQDLTLKMIEKYGPLFAAKAAVFARNELGMRSVANLTMAMVNDYQFDGKRDVFARYFRRPDDVAEVFAAIESNCSKRSHGAVRGAAKYLSGLNDYSLMKYQMSGKQYNMFDLINITHATSWAIDAYKAGTLSLPNTWEVRISAAKNDEEKFDIWADLISTSSLGYLALVRNLRNILSVSSYAANKRDFIDEVLCPAIENERAIKKSLIFPYQIYCAYKSLMDSCYNDFAVCASLDRAFRTAVSNMPTLDGKNVIVLDVSASMSQPISAKSNMSILEVGACYAAAMVVSHSSDFDFYKFGIKAKICDYDADMNVFTLIRRMCDNDQCGYGTAITPVFQSFKDSYDRIFLISDMQVMDSNSYWQGCGVLDAVSAMRAYTKNYGQSHIYSFDLATYHSCIKNPDSDNITMLTALNDKVFSLLKYFENGGNVIEAIKSISV